VCIQAEGKTEETEEIPQYGPNNITLWYWVSGVCMCEVLPDYKISWVYYNKRIGNLTLQIQNVEIFHDVDS